MKEIIYYEAFDGTRFDDKDECMDYENEFYWITNVEKLNDEVVKMLDLETEMANFEN